MSELFDDDPREHPAGRDARSRRSRALIITAVVLVVAFFGLSTFASLYTDRLWYHVRRLRRGLQHAVLDQDRAVPGLRRADGARGRAQHAAWPTGCGRCSGRTRPSRPVWTATATRSPRSARWLLVGVSRRARRSSPAAPASGEWRNYLLWRNGGVRSTREDAYFNKDIGFYVFDLPWLHYLVDFVMAVDRRRAARGGASCTTCTAGSGCRPRTTGSPGAAQAQLSVLLGVFVLAKGGDYWLDRFDLVHQGGALITGMTYTDDHAVLPAKNILMGIAVICAVLFFLNVWRRTWLLPSVGLALLALSAILLGLIWPGHRAAVPGQALRGRQGGAVHRGQHRGDPVGVRPRPTSKVRARTPATPRPPTGAAGRARSARRPSIPLVDPQLVRQTFEQNQQVRAYYSVRRRARRRPLRDRRAPTGRWCSACASSTRAASTPATRTGRTCTPSTRTATA